jgi:hypothetical protein
VFYQHHFAFLVCAFTIIVLERGCAHILYPIPIKIQETKILKPSCATRRNFAKFISTYQSQFVLIFVLIQRQKQNENSA